MSPTNKELLAYIKELAIRISDLEKLTEHLRTN